MKDGLEARVRELAELVQYHADLYYNKSKPEITDAEFDALVVELRETVEALKKDQPANEAIAVGEQALGEVGAVPSYGKKVQHSGIMGSLDKETTCEGVKEWAKKYGKNGKVVVTPKIDGLAVRLNYKDGRLVEAATRGTGEIGQDITDNIKAMASIPKSLPKPITVEVRGEVYMKKSVFNELKESGERAFANPRNAASGSLLNKDPQVTGRRNLSFLAYDAISDNVWHMESEKRMWMAYDLSAIELVDIMVIDVSKFDEQAMSWEKRRPGLDYEIDGLVVALESMEDQDEAGWNGKCPRGKVAFKFKPEQKTALVLDIDWQVGRTGRLTPMARIEPTLVSGSTISNITLHNAANVATLNIAVGDEVLIEKGGDIIPQVVRVIERKGRKASAGTNLYPTKCPSCGGPVEYDDRKVSLWCFGSACPAKLEERVLHYVKTLDILGVGYGIVSGLCKAGYVKDVPDLYYLTQEQVIDVTGGTRAAEKVVTAILEKNQIPLAVFLDSLGIHGLGTSTSKDIAKKYKSLVSVLNVNASELTTMDGIGDKTAFSIVHGLITMRPMIDKLVQAVDVVEVVDATGPLAGSSFCLTGAMSKPRKAIESAIEAAGGEVRSSVGKGLTYLVQADANSASGKSEKAKKLGTKILGEAELWKMMGV